MARLQSEVTAEGQTSVPEELVRKPGKYSSEDIHRVLFPTPPARKPMTPEEIDESIGEYLREKHARR
jgi:hypothetical protein